MSVKLTTDFAWVIEAPGQHYLATRDCAGYEFHWTKLSGLALYAALLNSLIIHKEQR